MTRLTKEQRAEGRRLWDARDADGRSGAWSNWSTWERNHRHALLADSEALEEAEAERDAAKAKRKFYESASVAAHLLLAKAEADRDKWKRHAQECDAETIRTASIWAAGIKALKAERDATTKELNEWKARRSPGGNAGQIALLAGQVRRLEAEVTQLKDMVILAHTIGYTAKPQPCDCDLCS